ncbi:hypothetical protein T484DRAFT_1878669, partial [Baffinella frigidus]
RRVWGRRVWVREWGGQRGGGEFWAGATAAGVVGGECGDGEEQRVGERERAAGEGPAQGVVVHADARDAVGSRDAKKHPDPECWIYAAWLRRRVTQRVLHFTDALLRNPAVSRRDQPPASLSTRRGGAAAAARAPLHHACDARDHPARRARTGGRGILQRRAEALGRGEHLRHVCHEETQRDRHSLGEDLSRERETFVTPNAPA